MVCGIVRFGRRGLKTIQTWTFWSQNLYLGAADLGPRGGAGVWRGSSFLIVFFNFLISSRDINNLDNTRLKNQNHPDCWCREEITKLKTTINKLLALKSPAPPLEGRVATNFDTKICCNPQRFFWLLGPSDQNELYHTHYYPKYEI